MKKIEKTRSEDLKPDLAAERMARDAEVLAEQKAAAKLEAERQKEFKLQCEKEKYEKSYDRLFDDEPVRTTNQESDNDSDDFMWSKLNFPAWINLISFKFRILVFVQIKKCSLGSVNCNLLKNKAFIYLNL